jgi:hypothetical protein
MGAGRPSRGADHPGTLTTSANIAYWTGKSGEAREALRLFRDLPDQVRRFACKGHRHPRAHNAVGVTSLVLLPPSRFAQSSRALLCWFHEGPLMVVQRSPRRSASPLHDRQLRVGVQPVRLPPEDRIRPM